MRGHLTYSNVVSTLCLFLLLGGGIAYAANTIGSADVINESLRSRDIKNGQVKAKDLTRNAVNGTIVADNTITGDDVDESTLQSAQGNTGATGPQGIVGPPGPSTGPAGGDLTGTYPNPLIADDAVTTSDIANRTVNADDLDGADRSGSIDVGAITDGRCTTISGSVTGAEPGDVAMLTTDGTLPNGMLVYAQRALTDAVHIKVCNLSGATSAAITDLPVRVVTIH
jgi:hypothetical protein